MQRVTRPYHQLLSGLDVPARPIVELPLAVQRVLLELHVLEAEILEVEVRAEERLPTHVRLQLPNTTHEGQVHPDPVGPALLTPEHHRRPTKVERRIKDEALADLCTTDAIVLTRPSHALPLRVGHGQFEPGTHVLPGLERAPHACEDVGHIDRGSRVRQSQDQYRDQ
jgi:hypothetical protein